jgi:hypothetical protein
VFVRRAPTVLAHDPASTHTRLTRVPVGTYTVLQWDVHAANRHYWVFQEANNDVLLAGQTVPTSAVSRSALFREPSTVGRKETNNRITGQLQCPSTCVEIYGGRQLLPLRPLFLTPKCKPSATETTTLCHLAIPNAPFEVCRSDAHNWKLRLAYEDFEFSVQYQFSGW